MQDQTVQLARLGYASRGVVYVLVGGLAVFAAFGNGGQTTDSRGGLLTLLSQPFGAILLGAIGFGLLIFAVWRLLQAAFDADHLGREWQALVRRVGFGISSIAYVVLGITAVAWAFGLASPSKDSESSAKDWTAYILSAPLGQWLVGAFAVVVVGIGIALVLKAWTFKVEEHLALDRRARVWILPLGRIGFVARGLVFLTVGVFLLYAAIYSDPREARGLAGALKALQAQPYGWILFASTAIGLFAFGLFQFAVAYYRRIDVPDVKATAQNVERKARFQVSAKYLNLHGGDMEKLAGVRKRQKDEQGPVEDAGGLTRHTNLGAFTIIVVLDQRGKMIARVSVRAGRNRARRWFLRSARQPVTV